MPSPLLGLGVEFNSLEFNSNSNEENYKQCSRAWLSLPVQAVTKVNCPLLLRRDRAIAGRDRRLADPYHRVREGAKIADSR